jgi:ribose 5-phosphate isomerase B
LQYERTVTKIFAGSDHAGFALRGRVVAHLRERGLVVEDLGAPNTESSDYPDYAAMVGHAVRDNPGALGVLVCGTGMGICMAANKIHGIRAAAVWSAESARLAKAHNDANVLCLGARLTSDADAMTFVDTWLATEFEGGRHQRRLDKVAALELEDDE